MIDSDFEWDEEKNRINREKHGVSFEEAQTAFNDPLRIIVEDPVHSGYEERFYCYCKALSSRIMTVRFTHRGNKIRIIGAAYWRKGERIYEKENQET